MGSKLTEMLTSDEIVLFHAYWTWRDIAVHIVWLATFFVTCFGFFATLWGAEHWGGRVLIAVLIVATLLIRRMRRTEILVSDRRLLHKTDHKRPPIMDVTIADIEAIAHSPGFLGFGAYLSINVRGDAPARIALIPDLRSLWEVLARQAGLPLPAPTETEMKVAYHGAMLLCILAGLGLMTVVGTDLLDWMAGDEQTTGEDYALFFLLFVPAISTALVIGGILGWVVCAVIIRLFFSAEQARMWACMGYDRNMTGLVGWLTKWSLRPALRFLGWLYGQPMRCEDTD